MKARKVSAEERIFQGTMTQPPTRAAMMQPRLMLTYLGKRTVRSLAAEIEFAVIFVPTFLIGQKRCQEFRTDVVLTCAIYQESAAKKTAARAPEVP